MIARETIEAIKNGVKLVDLIGERVELKRRGNSYLGLCPFHNEKTPSFNVKDDQDFYHCFGCGASGGAISFVMHTQGLSFPEAVEYLAQKLGIAVKQTTGTVLKEDDRQIKKDLLKINELAQRFFENSLANAQPIVKTYLQGRSLTPALIEKFKIGFAPLDWHSLVAYLKKQNISETSLVASGLVKRNVKGELYSFYRGRIIFPIVSEAHKIIGFGARIIPTLFSAEEAESQAKYFNSPETAIYQKSKVLYGINNALEAIRRERSVFVVEGYLDVIGLSASGIDNVVATCGTALTKEHLKRLSRLSNKIKLLFDGDAAGREAAAKCFQIFLNSGVDVQAIFLPQGEDPHSLSEKYGAKLKSKLETFESKSLLASYLLSQFVKEGASNVADLGPATKAKIAENAAELIAQVQSPIEREQLISELCFLMDISPQVQAQLFQNQTAPAKIINSEATFVDTNKNSISDKEVLPMEFQKPVAELEKNLIRVVLARPKIFVPKILSEPNLCSLISASCLEFLESVYSISASEELSDEDKKNAFRKLLTADDADRFKIWKETKSMLKDSSINFDVLFEESVKSANKLSARRAQLQVMEAIKNAHNDEEKLGLIKQQFALEKLIRQ